MYITDNQDRVALPLPPGFEPQQPQVGAVQSLQIGSITEGPVQCVCYEPQAAREREKVSRDR